MRLNSVPKTAVSVSCDRLEGVCLSPVTGLKFMSIHRQRICAVRGTVRRSSDLSAFTCFDGTPT